MTQTPEGLVEAALFSAGKPLLVEELVQATHLKPDEVLSALQKLAADYAGRTTAIEIVKSGTKWAMAVRTDYAEHTKMLAAPEIPRKVLKTLALIAFHQPIKQSELKDMVGSVVYDHVHELYELGMITMRQDGITKILSSTERFPEYFGIDSTDPEAIRTELARRVGIVLKPKEENPGPANSAPQEAPETATPPSTPEAGETVAKATP